MEKKYEPAYVCWVERDFMGDRVTMRMTPHQRLMYRALCQAAMFTSTRPWLPDDDEELYLLADADSLEHWKANREAVLQKFYPVEVAGQRLLEHKRILHDWEGIMEYVDQRRAAGARGGQARAKHMVADANQDANQSKGNESKEKVKKLAALPRGLSDDFAPTENNRTNAKDLSLNLEEQLIAFKDFHRSKGSKYLDWNLAFNTWLRNARSFSRDRPAAPQITGSLTQNFKDLIGGQQ
jgi:hypothetical protein